MINLVQYFFNQENEYENWCSEHVGGYVFNHAGGNTGNVLHKVGCRHLTVPSRIGTYTTRYPKYCSDDLNELIAKADVVSNPYNWRRCKDCP